MKKCPLFSGNFLIYCSMLPPFKEALSKICTFICFWRFTRQSDSASIEENMPETVATTTQPNDHIRNGRPTVLISREPVSGEPSKSARVFRLFSKRRHNKRSRKMPEDEYVEAREVPALLSHNGHGTNGVTTGNDSDLVVQVTIEANNGFEQVVVKEEA